MNAFLERARAGDPLATEHVIESLRPRISKMAAYYARCCGEDTDDLLQEAWVGLLEALPSLDFRIGVPEQYLIQRARWRMLDAIKRAKVRRCSSLQPDEIKSDARPSAEVLAAAASVSEFTGQLKESQRAVLDCLLDGLTWREAGSSLGCSSANVAYHVRQIRRRYEEWTGE